MNCTLLQYAMKNTGFFKILTRIWGVVHVYILFWTKFDWNKRAFNTTVIYSRRVVYGCRGMTEDIYGTKSHNMQNLG